MNNQERIAQLEEEVRLLREKVELVRYLSPACPACQGKMTRSTRYQDLICLQEFGPCGMLEFGVKSRTPKVYASFTRTRLKGGTLTVDITRLYPKNIRLRKFYIADQEVSEEAYLGKFKPVSSPTSDLEKENQVPKHIQFQVKGQIMVDNIGTVEVDEMIWAIDADVAQSKVLSLIAREHGATVYWVNEPEVIKKEQESD